MKKNSFWKGKNVFVTGMTGFIGNWLVNELFNREANVFGLIKDFQSLKFYQKNFIDNGLNIIEGKIEDLDILLNTIETNSIDTVFHLASKNINIGMKLSPFTTFETNIRGTYNILEAIRTQKTRPSIILASSMEVGRNGNKVFNNKIRHPYETSKSCVEIIANSYADTFNLNLAIMRSENVYGGADLNWNRLIPGTIKSLNNLERPMIRSGGRMLRDYIYVVDAIEAYLCLGEFIESNNLKNKVINLCSDNTLTALDIVENISQIMDVGYLKPIITDESFDERSHSIDMGQNAKDLLGWSSQFDIYAGLTQTIKWFNHYFSSIKKVK
tara:strand:- start:1116 stop:2096 length:981 start_codon:yes stop_codon:yes gene_type:complete